ncbi:hypothetical protein HDV06_000827 [Boothiomyces sp. JEL0866]|nr:hypothetical protein HDV06_000827 [Boothiomyces sp. JEL0866]
MLAIVFNAIISFVYAQSLTINDGQIDHVNCNDVNLDSECPGGECSGQWHRVTSFYTPAGCAFTSCTGFTTDVCRRVTGTNGGFWSRNLLIGYLNQHNGCGGPFVATKHLRAEVDNTFIKVEYCYALEGGCGQRCVN